ncbi:MAG: ankyrin repeat domain-containing protein [Rhodocyclaceae bacterium]|nr:ankyrin repeat domain-containing protein [Rhodocyclaceae bacterium]
MKRAFWVLGFLAALTCNAAIAGAYEDLLKAIEQNDTATVRTLVERGMDANTTDPQGSTLLHWAARHGNLELTRFLLAQRANPNRRNRFGDTPLMLAALAGQLDVVRLLLDHRAKVDLGGWNALHYAAFNGHAEILPWLLAAGAEIDKPAPNGETALMLASRNGHFEAVRVLVGSGAKVDYRAHGKTAQDLAQENNHLEIAEFLQRAPKGQ